MAHRAKKRFGQNFLQDEQIIDKIVLAIQALSPKNLVEIGPGQGAITEKLLQFADPLNVVEIDRDLVDLLTYRFGSNPAFKLHSADALKFDFSSLAKDTPLTVVGNLPYNISTPLIFHLFASIERVSSMLFMLQKEVVERLCAQPGTKDYGRLSVMTQYFCHSEMLFLVPPESFHPAPKVMSAIVRLTPKTTKPEVGDIALFEQIVRTAFSLRRKTIRNVWKNLIDAEALEQLNINPSRRPETLSLDEFASVSRYLSSKPA